ncbi:hypothetical protein [Haliscomenobacter hydrossis]|uniref:Uncharacterized protein n=1 Tax=Haliscomenobacter hydrossis (strain ATCC 27775 / DSM 1100 / LMG 10767 / O) TaxID=760192 RepID=F4L3T1_HALH1|nr:hypothetical protein [Haliscomenobacter hydrossis]AEE48685.1 hypothetical protein Halhy_0778 [Haliscomenobacter hydrossis DSM 1100]
MRRFLAITTTLAFLGMFAVTTSAQKVTGVGTTPGYYNSGQSANRPVPVSIGTNSANRRVENAPREDYRTPRVSSNGGRYDDRDDRNSGYRRAPECTDRQSRGGGYSSRDDDRRRDDDRDRYNDRGKKEQCCCSDKHHHHDGYGYGTASRGRGPADYREGGYRDYRDRDDDRDRDRGKGSRGSCDDKSKSRSRGY